MNTTNDANFNNTVEDEDQAINFREIFDKYLYHWPVFVVGVLLCLTAAFFYLRYTQEVYSVNSVLLIKDEKNSPTPGGDILSDLDIFGSSKTVDNEIEILKSKTLMSRVVKRLNLTLSYHVEGRVIKPDIYKNKPVDIGVVQMDSLWYGTTLNLTFPTLETYQLVEPESGKKVTGILDSLQKNIFGIFKIEPNQNFNNWMTKKSNPIFLSINDPQIVIDNYLKNLTVAVASKQSTVLDLTLETTVVERGKAVLNTLVQVYNEAALADKNRTTQSTMDFIDVRAKLISGELNDAEKDVERYKSARGLTDLSSDASVFLDNVKANDAKLSEVNLKLSVIEDIRRYVNSNSPGEKLPSTLGIEDPTLLAQINQLGELQLQKDNLIATTGENNPRLLPIESQIETLRSGIKASVENIYESVTNTKKSLEGTGSQIQGTIKKVPGQERQLIGLERKKSIKETIYLYLLQKKEEAALSYASAVADSRIVDPAYGDSIPVKPKKQLVFLAALVLGFLLPMGYVYGKDALNNKVETSGDISKLTNTPLLGEVLYEDGSNAIVVTGNSRKAIAEQFRAIRTNMQFLHGKQQPGVGKVTLFTSSMSGEGKSFVASNIAAAMAIAGKKTVLLELDLRKPKVSKYLDLKNKIGLSNYLIGKASIEDIVKQTSIDPNFYVIGSGPIPPNPAELLIQSEIDDLLTYLRANFDEILIDSPPIGLVTDAQILARLTDATIYLVRQDVTFKHQIRNLEQLYQGKKFPKLNLVLNGVKMGGRYGYGYGNGYGYGYYSDDAAKTKVGLGSFLKDIVKRF
ncbi:tyrosine-protein kinase Etk/Wzc [Pedobacter sp. UYP30]|uniref:GumC family protein n=1 Tax=Pedobacter sp. UYP30 TaxID=1756400 RepID=UPI00339276BB